MNESYLTQLRIEIASMTGFEVRLKQSINSYACDNDVLSHDFKTHIGISIHVKMVLLLTLISA